jgi:hypothetical protein
MPKLKKSPGRGSDQFVLRFPDGMRDRIASLAAENGRSMNAEIISRLEQTFENDETVLELWRKVEKLEEMVKDHDEQLNPMRYHD